jgi:hypothetical protein
MRRPTTRRFFKLNYSQSENKYQLKDIRDDTVLLRFYQNPRFYAINVFYRYLGIDISPNYVERW